MTNAQQATKTFNKAQRSALLSEYMPIAKRYGHETAAYEMAAKHNCPIDNICDALNLAVIGR